MGYIAAGPVVAMVLDGDGAVAAVRKMMGKTNSAEAELGTIRGDLAMTIGRNIIHGSDSAESAKREMALFFKPDEILSYTRIDEAWLREESAPSPGGANLLISSDSWSASDGFDPLAHR